jgi:SNF2 family DNA or RNA helicase
MQQDQFIEVNPSYSAAPFGTVYVTCRSLHYAALSAADWTETSKLRASILGAGYSPYVDHRARELILGFSDLASVYTCLPNWKFAPNTAALEAMTLHTARLEQHINARAIANGYLALPESAVAELSPLVPEHLLDLHQIVAVAAAAHESVSGICLFDEQGLGKTLQAIAAFHVMKQRGMVQRGIVVAPKNMLTEWERDIDRFFPDIYRVEIASGSRSQRRVCLSKEADIYITNYETVLSEASRLSNLVKLSRGETVLIVDESYYAKNSEAKRTSAVKKLRALVSRCIVLCGTPAPNCALDIVEQFNIADGGLTFGDRSIPADVDAAKQFIGERIYTKGVFIRRLKAEVMPELPGKTFHNILVPLSNEQRRLYDSWLHEYVRDLKRTDESSFVAKRMHFLARRSKLLRVCSDPTGVTKDFGYIPTKSVAMDELLLDLVGRRREKVVVWSSYTNAIDEMMRRYGHYDPVRFDGRVVSMLDRKRAITRFQDDESCQLFIANPAAASAGITLHRSRFAIYQSLPTQTAAYFQSLDRIHRRGQDRPVEYLILLAENTLEVSVNKRLAEKAQSSRELLSDPNPEDLTRHYLLSEAMEALSMGATTVADVIYG